MANNPSGIRPLGDQVLVFPDPMEQVTASGIQIMTDKELDRLELGQTEGVVVAGAGEGYEVGDRIIFTKYSGLLMDGVDGLRYRLVDKRDVRGVYENE